MDYIRVSALRIPATPVQCRVGAPCPYRDCEGWCDEPRISKRNGDARCHRMNNKDLLPMLGPAPAREE